MKKRFIVLVDFSEHSKTLLRFAGNWAKSVNAELLVVNQVFSVAPAMGEGEIRDEIKRQEKRSALAQLSGFVKNVWNDSGVSIKLYVTTGSLQTAIDKLHRSKNLDLIFTGVTSTNWIERIFMQSTALRLSNEIDKMIVALPDKFKNTDFENMQVAVAPQFPLNEDAFQQLVSITAPVGKTLSFFSVLKPGETEETMVNYFKSLGSKFGNLIPTGYDILHEENAPAGIKKYMQQHGGLLVVQKGTRTFSDFFRKYLIHDLLHSSQIPLIILP